MKRRVIVALEDPDARVAGSGIEGLRKAGLAVANGEQPYRTFADKLEEFERTHPVSLRHLLDFRTPLEGEPLTLARTKTGEHDAPPQPQASGLGERDQVRAARGGAATPSPR